MNMLLFAISTKNNFKLPVTKDCGDCHKLKNQTN